MDSKISGYQNVYYWDDPTQHVYKTRKIIQIGTLVKKLCTTNKHKKNTYGTYNLVYLKVG